MTYYSHVREEDGKRIGTKELLDHLNVVNNFSIKNLANTNFSKYSKESIIELLKYSSLFHDLGKYTDYFQDYLLNGNDTREKRYHTQISSIFTFNYLLENKVFKDDKRNFLPFMAYYIIKSHHSSLKSLNEDVFLKPDKANFKNYIEYQKINLLKNFNNIKKELNQIDFNNYDKLFILPVDNIKNLCCWLSGREKSIENYFFILYCFSLLIESDKMNASDTPYYQYKTISPVLISDYIKSKNNELSEINLKRTEVRQIISSQVDNIDLEKNNIFTITAPTGIGKTLASLEFALKLREKIFNTENRQAQIIYCLPFINIIEQTAREFANVFKDEDIEIIKHHQFTEILSKDKEDESSQNHLDKRLMEIECWQGDIIITTFVQLLHTIIGNRNKLLKKFHHLAGSIIILDEVQSIDIKYWPLIGSVFFYLSKLLRSKVILMTATKPLLINSAYKSNLIGKNSIDEKELLDNHQKYFNAFERTKIVSLINKGEPYTIDSFKDLFKEKWNCNKSALIVLNTIKRSVEVYKAIKELNIIPEECLFYLSTNIIPAKRLVIISKIKRNLKEGKKIILISTQCVEAGVDLDFDMGFRDIGPIDSIIQVAGRINRNNNPDKKFSPLYIIDFEKDCSSIYGIIVENESINCLTNKEFPEPDYLTLVEDYFQKLLLRMSNDKSLEIFEAMQKLNFTSFNGEKSVSDFELIKSKHNYVDLFVEIDSKASLLLNCYKKYLNEENIKVKRKIQLRIKKSFNKFILSVPMNKIYELVENKIGENLYLLPNNKINNFYNGKTGFIRDLNSDDFIY